MWDYRANGKSGKFVTQNAYLFTATFSDHTDVEFRCNPEFINSDALLKMVEKYAQALGRIPQVFRSRVDIIDLNRGDIYTSSIRNN